MPDVMNRFRQKDELRDVLIDELEICLPARWAMLLMLPVMRLSMTMTLWPRASNRSTRWEPRNPAPPVTTEVGCVVFKERFRFNGINPRK